MKNNLREDTMKQRYFKILTLFLFFSLQACGSSPGNDPSDVGGGTGDITGEELNKEPGTYKFEGELDENGSFFYSSIRKCYYDMYDFEGTEGYQVDIKLTSTDFDPYFLVYYEFDETQDLSDNTLITRGVSGTTRFDVDESGVYTILVLDEHCVKTGDYTLTYTLSEP